MTEQLVGSVRYYYCNEQDVSRTCMDTTQVYDVRVLKDYFAGGILFILDYTFSFLHIARAGQFEMKIT
jgi:hypothetical protein